MKQVTTIIVCDCCGTTNEADEGADKITMNKLYIWDICLQCKTFIEEVERFRWTRPDKDCIVNTPR